MTNQTSTFTKEINALMIQHAPRCPHARAALSAFASGGESSPAYMSARMSFAQAYAARSETHNNRFLISYAIATLATLAALFLSL